MKNFQNFQKCFAQLIEFYLIDIDVLKRTKINL